MRLKPGGLHPADAAAAPGAPPDREYSAQEQQDAEEVIAWLASQPWSNGKVGMLGISWGGFNSIQMALSVTMVTGAGINGAQRDSMAQPEDLVPGKIYPLSLDLHLASWVFPKGHRIRVAVSNALWPMNWPTPYPMTTSVMLGADSARPPVSAANPAGGAAPARKRTWPDPAWPACRSA